MPFSVAICGDCGGFCARAGVTVSVMLTSMHRIGLYLYLVFIRYKFLCNIFLVGVSVAQQLAGLVVSWVLFLWLGVNG